MTLLALYRGLTGVMAPAVGLYLRRRIARGKEDATRIAERRGVPSRVRPPGPLIWLHAASVGEAQSALSLMRRLVEMRPDGHLLITTGTVTSAQLFADRLPPRSFHQFVPLDQPSWARRFLDHWQPNLALWMESELWPNLLTETTDRGVPTILVNARMSARSFGRWRLTPRFARNLLGRFALCLAQTEEQAARFRELGAPRVDCLGNLKFSAAPLPVSEPELATLRAALHGRPLWLAASTHPGEEAMAAEVHLALQAQHPRLLTVIAPRHPARGDEIVQLLAGRGLAATQRSAGALPDAGCAVYVADTLGELGLFYRLAGIAFVGGSTQAHGGHNPLEPAQLGCAILHGPDMANFQSVAADLQKAGGALRIVDAAGLADAVGRLLDDAAARRELATAATTVAERNKNVVEHVAAAIAPYLEAMPRNGDARA